MREEEKSWSGKIAQILTVSAKNGRPVVSRALLSATPLSPEQEVVIRGHLKLSSEQLFVPKADFDEIKTLISQNDSEFAAEISALPKDEIDKVYILNTDTLENFGNTLLTAMLRSKCLSPDRSKVSSKPDTYAETLVDWLNDENHVIPKDIVEWFTTHKSS